MLKVNKILQNILISIVILKAINRLFVNIFSVSHLHEMEDISLQESQH